MTSAQVKRAAAGCGFELAGVAPASPLPEAAWYLDWVRRGMAGEMRYLAGHRAGLRQDPARLLPGARSVICVGKLYNGPEPYSAGWRAPGHGWISRYAWGRDYHDVMRRGLERLIELLRQGGAREARWKICIDTAPLLERAYARRAGLGWIGNNTCLINQQQGSWFFLGEVLTTLELEPDAPPPERCGTCTRCIDACPAGAIVPTGRSEPPFYTVDARRCISYLTIELRGAIPAGLRSRMGNHLFGCDVCQEVCPWNRRAPVSRDPDFAPGVVAPPLERMASLSEYEFGALFRRTPVWRARYDGFLRNVAVAMGNSGLSRFRPPLNRLARQAGPLVADHARWALARLGR